MRLGHSSIRARLLAGAALVLLLFITGAGFAVQRAHADSAQAAHFGRLQATVYLLLAGAELDDSGLLQMPPVLAEPRLALPGSGLYAGIHNVSLDQTWQSASTLGKSPPLQRSGEPGQWRYQTVQGNDGAYLAVTYGVRWTTPNGAAPLVLSVLEHKGGFDRELGVFSRTLWTWLGSAAALLLAAQLLLLRWALSPLRRVAQEVRRVESGEQAAILGAYPEELTGLTGNLNTLIQQERVRQTRYREALSFLAHSLKTPLAVLRGALSEPRELPAEVERQVRRMDDIVQYQLARAAAGGAGRFVPLLPLAPVLDRIVEALRKVYAGKGVRFEVECPADLAWRIDEGDLFEMLGNLMDNAAKWAGQQVRVRVAREANRLVIVVEDDGPGFTDTESVLKLHVRADERVPGHGVGLAVVNDLVASAHGELALARSPLGGARVEIVLPAA